MESPREQLAAQIWREVAVLTGHADAMPSWRIIRQRRATFSATPQQDARRPGVETSSNNLFLAGAYVGRGTPTGLESTIRSGQAAARAVIERIAAG